MNNRLQQFLELENLTPSQLADKLGVQRSGLSHILSGRNKPGYDFISKLLTKFPTVNAEWIITGKGRTYKEVLPSPNNFNSSNNSAIPKFQEENLKIISKNNEESESSSLYFDAFLENNTEDNSNAPLANTIQQANNEQVTSNSKASKLNENELNKQNNTVVQKKRTIKRVIVFYSDGSFEELFPNR